MREKDFCDAVFHAQQCVEKCIKALVESKGEYVCNHGLRITSVFIRFLKMNGEVSLRI